MECCGITVTGLSLLQYSNTPISHLPFSSQLSFRARQTLDARITPARRIDRLGQRLENRLDDVMRLVATEDIHVQVAARLVGEALQEFFHQPDAKALSATQFHVR